MNRWRMLLQAIAFVLSLLPSSGDPAGAADVAPKIAGLSAEEALRLGEAMYLKGTLPSGKPMQAIVQKDIALTGTMVTCSNCHMRSGLGSYEGGVLTLPTNGAKLYSPLTSGQDLLATGMAGAALKHSRPAYTDESLAEVLRTGVDPKGRILSETMPRYHLDDREMEIMVFYLKNLSSKYSPGVTEKMIKFGTVVTEEVSSEDRNAMLAPLMAYIEKEWNARVNMPFQKGSGYRALSLDVWELKGSPETWRDQLEALYKQQPVFALLGGISSRRWDPIHKFCEKKRIPGILPITDLPEISGSDWYTLYFSKGYYQEGETAAKFLSRVFDLPPDKQIVQVFRENDEGNALSRGFAETWKKIGTAALKNRVLSAGETTDRDFWKVISSVHPNAVVLLWLLPEDLKGLESLGELRQRPSMVFISSKMLAGKLLSLPDNIGDFTFITYPNRLPDEGRQITLVVDTWLKARKISSTNMTISSKTYFLTRMLVNTVTRMRDNFYRDYFLDLFDVLTDQTTTIAAYPRLSFGPGQRYASKGCYIVALRKGQQPKIVRQSDWIIY